MKKRILFSLVFAAITFVVVLAMQLPPRNAMVYVSDQNDVSAVLTLSDVDALHNCIIDGDSVVPVGEDSYIVFNDLSVSFSSVKVNLDSEESGLKAQLFFEHSNAFCEQNSVLSYYHPDTDGIIANIAFINPTNLRLDIDSTYTFESIELHKNPLKCVPLDFKHTKRAYLLSLVSAIIVGTILFFVDKRFFFSQKIFSFLNDRVKSIIKGVITIIASGALAAILELLVSIAFPNTVLGQAFNQYRFFFIFGIILATAFIVFMRKVIGQKPENAFLGLVLIIGATFILASPFGHICWDLDSHYKWSINQSYLFEKYITVADTYIIDNNPNTFLRTFAVDNHSNVATLNSLNNLVVPFEEATAQITHYPSAVFLAVARLLGFSFYESFVFGKFANLLLYAFVCYLGIRKLKSSKILASIIALFPTAIFIASNYAYDHWITAFAILGMCYFVSELQQDEKPIKAKDTVIMCGAFAVASLPKLVYAPLLFIPLFLRKKNFLNKRRYYLVCFSIILIFFALLGIRFLTMASGSGDSRGGDGVNAAMQVSYILNNLFEYIKTLVRFLMGYLSPTSMHKYITHFAYFKPGKLSIIIILLLVFTTLTDKSSVDIKKSYPLLRIFAVAMFLGLAALIATAMYISFTPVGHHTINGCQLRYLIPLLFPLLSVLGVGFNNKLNPTVYNLCTLVPCAAVSFFNIAYAILPTVC